MDKLQNLDPKYCPIRHLLDRLGDKWSLLVIDTLAHAGKKPSRFSELKRGVHGISQRMLTETLRNLERDGLVTRDVFPQVPPRVEYALTERGRGLLKPVRALIDWVGVNWPDIEKSRNGYDETHLPKSQPSKN